MSSYIYIYFFLSVFCISDILSSADLCEAYIFSPSLLKHGLCNLFLYFVFLFKYVQKFLEHWTFFMISARVYIFSWQYKKLIQQIREDVFSKKCLAFGIFSGFFKFENLSRPHRKLFPQFVRMLTVSKQMSQRFTVFVAKSAQIRILSSYFLQKCVSRYRSLIQSELKTYCVCIGCTFLSYCIYP